MLNSLTAGLAAATTVTLSMIATAPAAQAAENEWKMHVIQVATRQEAMAAQTWADRINARAGDDLEIKVFPGGSLGIKDADMIRILPQGNILQANLMTTLYVSRDAPEVGFLLPEGVIPKLDDVPNLVKPFTEAGQAALSGFGIKALSMIVPPDRSIDIYCKTPVNTLEELRTKKLRVWGAFSAAIFEKLGISATVIPQADLYMAMQTGVVDCATYYPGAANTISLQEVAPYSAYITPYINPTLLVVSEKAWDKLTPETQTIVQEESDRLSEEMLASMLAGTYQTEQSAIYTANGGTEIEPFSEEDSKAYFEAATEAWKELADLHGEKLQKNRAAIIATFSQ